MRIGLIDVDGHNFPNLALMKLSAWHKAQGDTVNWFKRFAECLQERSEWYEKMVKGANEEYADEKLRQEAQRCSGIEIEYLYEAEAIAANKKREEELLCR